MARFRKRLIVALYFRLNLRLSSSWTDSHHEVAKFTFPLKSEFFNLRKIILQCSLRYADVLKFVSPIIFNACHVSFRFQLRLESNRNIVKDWPERPFSRRRMERLLIPSLSIFIEIWTLTPSGIKLQIKLQIVRESPNTLAVTIQE